MARDRAMLTQEGLAAAIGLARPGTVGDWESGKSLPEGRYMVQLPEVLNVSADWLLTGKPTPEIASLPHEVLVQLRDWMRKVLPPDLGE